MPSFMSNKCVYLFISLFHSLSISGSSSFRPVARLFIFGFACRECFHLDHKNATHRTFKCDDMILLVCIKLNYGWIHWFSVLGLNLFRIDTHFLPHRSEWTFYSNEIQCLHLRTFSVALFFFSPSISLRVSIAFLFWTISSQLHLFMHTFSCVLFYDQLILLIVLQTNDLNGFDQFGFYTYLSLYSSQHRFDLNL